MARLPFIPAQNLQSNIKPIEVKGGRQLVLTGEPAKPQRFDKDQAKNDDLYKWSSLRSAYLGEANVDLASEYAGYGGFSPAGTGRAAPSATPGCPGDGLFWNPFGYGFYSPYYLYGGGFIYGRSRLLRIPWRTLRRPSGQRWILWRSPGQRWIRPCSERGTRRRLPWRQAAVAFMAAAVVSTVAAVVIAKRV